MPLAASIQVKISSEAAEAVALTPVVVRDMPLAELMEMLAAAAASNPERVRDLLKRGVVVSGASRFRWQPLDCTLEDVAAALELIPKPDPSLPFAPGRGVRVAVLAGSRRWNLTREAASRRRVLHQLLLRSSFWDRLVAALPTPTYVTYSIKDRADVYRLELDEEGRRALQSAASLLPFSSLSAELRSTHLTTVEWLVTR